MHSCHFISLKPFTLRMHHAKLLDVLTSFPKCHAILPRAVCFATLRLANHAICSFIDSCGYASGQIRRCLFIDYILMIFIMNFLHGVIKRSIEGLDIFLKKNIYIYYELLAGGNK